MPTLYSKIEGKGAPLLILHGFLGMSDNWKTLGTRFAADGFEVHMLDMRNHGRSFHSDDFTYAAMVTDITAYCDAHNLQTINLLGHSMGGKAAMFFATQFPERIDKLIIADIGPRYYEPHHSDILAGISAVDFSQKPDRNQVEEILKPYIPDLGTRQFVMKSLYWKEPGQLAFRFNLEVFLKNRDTIGEALPQNAIYAKDVLFLRGENSGYINEEYEVAEVMQHFPKAHIETIKNAGHWLHAENPADFYRECIAFLK